MQEAQDPMLDDSGWRTVSIPHDFGIEGAPTRLARSTVGYQRTGSGWYRKRLDIPTSWEGKRIVLNFDGVMAESEVYVDGNLVCEHHNGYAPFEVDIASCVKPGSPALVAVHSDTPEPCSRWYPGAGIYREVALRVTDPAGIAHGGLRVTTPTLEADHAAGYTDLHVEVRLNDDGRATAAPADEVLVEVLDAADVVVQSARASVKSGADSSVRRAAGLDDLEALAHEGAAYAFDTELVLRIDDPHLWSTSDPYRYAVRVIVLREGEPIDMQRELIGLRWITLDPATGFYLNGVHMRLAGMCLHHDLGALGAAAHRDAIRRQLRIMKDGGVNAIRTSHNIAAKALVDEASAMGLLVLEELCDMWTAPKDRNDYSRHFVADAPEDLRAMIERDRNEPSVFMWSLGNEVAWQPEEIPYAKALRDWAHALDDTRPVSVNDSSYLGKGIDGIGNDIHEQLDVRGYSYISKDKMIEVHQAHPDDVILNSESGNATSCRGYYVHPTDVPEAFQLRGRDFAFPQGRQPWDPETFEITAYNATSNRGYPYDVAFERLIDLPFNVGEFGWTGIDYIGEPAPWIGNFWWNDESQTESDGSVLAPRVAYYGMVDSAGFPKDQWYLFRSLWTHPSDAPMVHLLPHWTWSPSQQVAVWAYTNARSVELFLNGKSLGLRSFESYRADFSLDPAHAGEAFEYRYAADDPEAKRLNLSWEIPFEPGELIAVARDANGHEVARDAVRTAGAAAAVRLTPDRAAAARGELVFVTAEVVDAAGTVCPWAEDTLTFSIAGGELLGCDNGYQASTEAYQSPRRRAYAGKVLAIVRAAGGQLGVSATAPGLCEGSCIVNAGADARVAAPAPCTPIALQNPYGEGCDAPDIDPGGSSAAELESLEVNGQPVARFSPARKRYEVELAPDADAPAVGARAAQGGSVAIVPSSDPTCGTYSIFVTSANGANGAHYALHVSRKPVPRSAKELAEHALPVDSIFLRAEAGSAPVLPAVVKVEFDDAPAQMLPVAWNMPAALPREGSVEVAGTIEGPGLPATAHVTVSAVRSVESVDSITYVGIAPDLDETNPRVAVTWADGVVQELAVTWDDVPASMCGAVGALEVSGIIEGISIPATATVAVTDHCERNRDLFSYRNDMYPQVKASYTNSDPAVMEDASNLMDGTISYTAQAGYNLKNRWSTFGDPDRQAWLEYRFGYGTETPFMLDGLTAYYCLEGEGAELPESVEVSWWDGESWQRVQGLSWEDTSVEQENSAGWIYGTFMRAPEGRKPDRGLERAYRFKMVRTSRVRIDFTSKPGSCVALTEIRGDAKVPCR